MARAGAVQSRMGLTMVAAAVIALGTFAAMSSVPDDVRSPDTLFLPALFMAIALIVPVVIQVRSDLTSVLRVENALLIGIVYWLLMDMLQSAYPFEFVT